MSDKLKLTAEFSESHDPEVPREAPDPDADVAARGIRNAPEFSGILRHRQTERRAAPDDLLYADANARVDVKLIGQLRQRLVRRDRPPPANDTTRPR